MSATKAIFMAKWTRKKKLAYNVYNVAIVWQEYCEQFLCKNVNS